MSVVEMDDEDWAKYRVFAEDHVKLDDTCIDLINELIYCPCVINWDIKQFLGPGDQIIMDFRVRYSCTEAVIRLPGGYYILVRIPRNARTYCEGPSHRTPDAKIYPLPRDESR